ncbi:hypothetical protein [Rhodanobacter sp. KK11]|jgi:hypothetical protein|uniref:hypothetical protein n=1 Tax=Rhodanobacter sp. KK11 TaxID=3083255 RepID=UPI00296709AA|nr:hypothetical protein [Rhodanobacter sp. KK11]MDW2981736.1 hypothetical protein [Rhodanobacter sp. KK11]
MSARLLPADFVPPEAPDPYEVEANLSPAVRRDVRLTRIAAYEGTRWAEYIPGERVCLEFDA